MTFSFRIVSLFVFGFALLFCGRVQASDVSYCIGSCFSSYSCSLQSGSGYGCEGNRDRCVQQCNANAGNGGSSGGGYAYGAIAYDKESGAWGMANGSPDKSSAKKSAMHFCSQHGDNCKVVENFSSTCAAVAEGSDNRLAWATDDNGKRAAQLAVEKCNTSQDGWFSKHSDGGSCTVALRHCYH